MFGPRTFFLLLFGLTSICGGLTHTQAVPGIKVPEGFKVTQVAGDELATNIYCMTVSPRGEVFVSGPGYIKALIDTDGDGVFDQARQFADAPKSGAQGMCFDGTDLLCTGDGGLLRFEDADGDGVADGEPKKILAIKTGGEHDAHAIRKGPDGWWYLLAGNGVSALPEYYAGENSPVKHPRAGFLMRFSPDGTEKEIYCHGFRNAYDFDFNSLGQIFVFDSDGERDITLPWYRPTRVYRMRPGDDAGWVAKGWKRPSSFLDMPIEVGALGRGSPTGVAVSASKQFPASDYDAVFVGDWTFGRVVVFRQDRKTGQYDRGTEFAVADGQFGFAVTDLAFLKDGSLLVSAGGRGTQGAVYRIDFQGDRETFRGPPNASRIFVKATKSEPINGQELVTALTGPVALEREAALEALVGRRDVWGPDAELDSELAKRMSEGLRKSLGNFQLKTAGLVLRIAQELDTKFVDQIDHPDLPVESRMTLRLATARTDESKQKLIEDVAQRLAIGEGDPESLSRIAQLASGGCGPPGVDPMFAGYQARSPQTFSPQRLNAIANNLALALELGTPGPDQTPRGRDGIDEIGRLAGMLGCRSTKLQESMARFLGHRPSSVSRDIHWMNCISQTSNDLEQGFPNEVESRIASALAGLSDRIKRDGLNLDRNFYPRMKSLVKQLFQRDDGTLAKDLATNISGVGDDAYLVDVLPKEVKSIAVQRFAEKIEQAPADVTAAQINVLAGGDSLRYAPLIRKFNSRSELRDVVLSALARHAFPEDRELFVSGLRASNLDTVKKSATALRKYTENPNRLELVYALLASRKMGWDKPAARVRDELVSLLQERTEQDFGYQPKQNGLNQNDVLQEWSFWIQEEYPQEFEAAFQSPATRAFSQRMESVDWETGDEERGQRVYKKLQCAQCHSGGSRLGPRLEGIGKRFGRKDLFRSIVTPNQQVPQRYRALVIETVDGQLVRGSVVYESVDGITLQEVGGQTVRLNQADIEARTLSEKSLMPEGLLNEATDQEWSDLYTFLKSL